jgi:CubicO group peptidase (beta-lactamase class C family)
MKELFLIILIAAAFFSASSIAKDTQIKRLDDSTISAAEIDANVTRLMRAAQVAGVSIAIFNDGRLDYLKTYGFRDKEKDLPLTGNSVMTGASFTKVAFAYMVMQLVQEKILALDKPVYEYLSKPLPEYPQYQDLARDSRYQKITVRMLLDHTSGFANLRFLEPDRKLKIHFEPGTRYAYSGEGMMLLQLVVETITKRTLAELMDARVFKPLGMTRTGMVWEDRFENDFANGYDEYSRSLGPDRQKRANAAGSMLTTPNDFAQFILAVMRGNGLKRETRELMLGPQIQIFSKHQFPTLVDETTDENRSIRLSYGLGWGLYWTPYGKAFFKEGHSEGWRNYTVGFDRKQNGIVIMTNSSNGEGIFKELLETLQRNTFTPSEWEGYTPYTQLPPLEPLPQRTEITLEAKLLDKYVGRYGNPPDLILKITREGNHIFIQENDESRQELAAQSETTFVSKSSSDSLTFESDEHGRVVRMVLQLDAKDLPLRRID